MNDPTRVRILGCSFALGAAIALAGCGGGGSAPAEGGGPPPPPPESPPPQTESPPPQPEPPPPQPEPPPPQPEPPPPQPEPPPPQPEPPPPPPEPPPPQPEPGLPQFEPPPVVEPTCVETADYGCIEAAEYEARRRAIEETYRAEAGFTNQWGLGAVRADRAWAQVELTHGAGTAPGAGITVGAIDTGIDTGHPVFAGKTVTEHFFPGTPDEDGSEFSHGTAVAGVMVGRPSDTFLAEYPGARGVAWGADIAMFALRAGTPGERYGPTATGALGSADGRWKERFDTVLGWENAGRSLDFVNLSVGLHGIIEQFSEQDLRENLSDTIATLAQSGASDRTVFVWAAGNAHGKTCDANDFRDNPDLCVDGKVNAKSPEVLAGLPARITELEGLLLSVVATAEDGAIAPFSNRCGIAANWCLAAPGVEIRTAYHGPPPPGGAPGVPRTARVSGTSVAAPMVTGGLAVMQHRFRGQLSNTALVERLLATADKKGIYADRSIYGQGLMDLGASTATVGETSLALGERVEGPGLRLAGTHLALGGALGDGLAQAFAGQEVAAFDQLGAPFWYSLGDLAGAAPAPTLGARLRAFMAPAPAGPEGGVLRPGFASLSAGGRDPLRLGLMEAPPPGVNGGHLSLAGNALTLGAVPEWGGLRLATFAAEGRPGHAPAAGAALSWRPLRVPVGLRSGLVSERETLLGSRAAGAFGRVSSRSAFAGLEGGADAGGWRLDAGAEIGVVDAAARGGLLSGVTPLTTSAFALRAERPLAEGAALSLSLAQPLRVESGRATLSVPVGRTPGGRVLRRSLTAQLEPSGRQIDLAVKWRRRFAAGGELRLGSVWSLQPGHDASEDPELSVFAGWRGSF